MKEYRLKYLTMADYANSGWPIPTSLQSFAHFISVNFYSDISLEQTIAVRDVFGDWVFETFDYGYHAANKRFFTWIGFKTADDAMLFMLQFT